MANLESKEKQALFENNAYQWDSRISSFINVDKGKIFTSEYIDDHSIDNLENNLCDAHDLVSWKIYCNDTPNINHQNIFKYHGESPAEKK